MTTTGTQEYKNTTTTTTTTSTDRNLHAGDCRGREPALASEPCSAYCQFRVPRLNTVIPRVRYDLRHCLLPCSGIVGFEVSQDLTFWASRPGEKHRLAYFPRRLHKGGMQPVCLSTRQIG